MQMLSLLLISAICFVTAVLAESPKPVKKTFTVGGKKISCMITAFRPPPTIRYDEKRMDQSSAYHCSLLLYSYLSKGDIKSASKLGNDPARLEAKYNRNLERLGPKDFSSMFTGYFDGSAKFLYEITIGNLTMLIVDVTSEQMLAAQFYEKVGDRYVVAEKENADKDRLGELFRALQDGEIKIE
jgi:hypothetical protein